MSNSWSEERKATAARVAALNKQNLAAERATMRVWYITFGWGRPHGPSPENSRGGYAKLYAPDYETARMMANERYDRIWSMMYGSERYQEAIVSQGCWHLETLTYAKLSTIMSWPAHTAGLERKASD